MSTLVSGDSASSVPTYFVTIAVADGLTTSDLALLSEFTKSKFECCVGCQESHLSGLQHFHAIVQHSAKRPQQIESKYSRFMKNQEWVLTKNTIKVKPVHSFGNVVSYIFKDVTDDNPLLFVKGYKLTWLYGRIKNKQTCKTCR